MENLTTAQIYRIKNKVKLALHTKNYNLNLQATNPEEYLRQLNNKKEYNKLHKDRYKDKYKYKAKYVVTPEQRKIYNDKFRNKPENKDKYKDRQQLYNTRCKNKKLLLAMTTAKDTTPDEIF